MSYLDPTYGIKRTDSKISLLNHIDHILARFSIRRNSHRMDPGLYAIGKPNGESPVFVTANYTLSFDAVRSSLSKYDAFILVLDTRGVNVWCAAGKGTFATAELTHRIESCHLHDVVNHRKLIVPQLGATGVAAQDVKRETGFLVEFGPVRASDIPQYLTNGEATLSMRRVYFDFWDRLVLTPVEFIGYSIPMLILALLFYFIGGYLYAAGIIAAFVTATIFFPVLLPWIPTSDFSMKGFMLGGITAIIFFSLAIIYGQDIYLWQRLVLGFSSLLTLPAVTAFLTLNFTGATTFTSKSGVKKEIFRYIPTMTWMFGSGTILALGMTIYKYLGTD